MKRIQDFEFQKPEGLPEGRRAGGECQTSCQSACKTSCTVANQHCENKNK